MKRFSSIIAQIEMQDRRIERELAEARREAREYREVLFDIAKNAAEFGAQWASLRAESFLDAWNDT